MKGSKRAGGWGGLVLIAMLALSTAGCRFNFSSGNRDDAIPVTDQDRSNAMTAESGVLATLDADRFGEAWDEAAPIFRTIMKRDEFIAQRKTFRSLVPPGFRRTYGNGRFHSAPDKAPEGRYATFDNQLDCAGAICTEQVVMMEVDGTWRLAGYFVHKRKTFKL